MTMRPVKFVVGWKHILQLFQIHLGSQCALGLSGQQIVWTDICSIVSGVGCNSLYFRYINIAYQATMGAGGGQAGCNPINRQLQVIPSMTLNKEESVSYKFH